MNRLLIALACMLVPVSITYAQSQQSFKFLKANHKLSRVKAVKKAPAKEVEDNDLVQPIRLKYSGGSGIHDPLSQVSPEPSKFAWVNNNRKLNRNHKLPIKRIRAYEKKLEILEEKEQKEKRITDK